MQRYVLVLVAALLALGAPATAQSPQATTQLTQQQANSIVAAMWQQALGHLQNNEPRAAIPLLERLVSIAPAVTRFRLELARAYFLVEEDDKAAFHFAQAQGGAISPAERAAVQQFLDRIEARKNWDVQLTFNLRGESNPGKRTAAEVIDIGGLPFVLNDTAESGTGYDAGARLTYFPKISRDLSGRIQLGFSLREFSDDSLDEQTLSGELGLLQRQDGGQSLGFGLMADRREVDGEAFSESRGAYVDLTRTFDPRTRVQGRLSFKETTHEDLANRDGDTVSLSANLTRAISSQFVMRSGLSLSRTDAEAEFESGNTLGLTLGGTYSFEGGWTALIDAGVTEDSRNAPSGLFSVAREDVTYSLSVRGIYRELQVEGFTPILGLRYERRDSTLELYDFENVSVTFGLTRLF